MRLLSIVYHSQVCHAIGNQSFLIEPAFCQLAQIKKIVFPITDHLCSQSPLRHVVIASKIPSGCCKQARIPLSCGQLRTDCTYNSKKSELSFPLRHLVSRQLSPEDPSAWKFVLFYSLFMLAGGGGSINNISLSK